MQKVKTKNNFVTEGVFYYYLSNLYGFLHGSTSYVIVMLSKLVFPYGNKFSTPEVEMNSAYILPSQEPVLLERDRYWVCLASYGTTSYNRDCWS